MLKNQPLRTADNSCLPGALVKVCHEGLGTGVRYHGLEVWCHSLFGRRQLYIGERRAGLAIVGCAESSVRLVELKISFQTRAQTEKDWTSSSLDRF